MQFLQMPALSVGYKVIYSRTILCNFGRLSEIYQHWNLRICLNIIPLIRQLPD